MEKTKALFTEIDSYIERTGDYSYYNFKAELIQIKPEIADLLSSRTTAGCAAEYMKSAKRQAGERYKNTKFEAFSHYLDVLLELDENSDK